MNHFRTLFAALVMIAVTFSTQPTAHADLIDITDGTNSFAWDPDNGTSSFSSSWGNYSFAFVPMLRFVSPASGLDTFTMGDYSGPGVYRDIVTNSAVNAGDTGSQNVQFGTQNGLGSPTQHLEVDLNFTVSSNSLGAIVNYSMTVTNVSGSALSGVELFSYYDWDIGGTNQNAGLDATRDGFTGFDQLGPVSEVVFHGTDNLQNWEVAPWDTLRTKLLANGTLANSGTPFAVADMTAAFGWNIGTLDPGESFTVNFLIKPIPQISVVSPDSYLVTRGSYIGGGVAELAASDNADLAIRRSAQDIQSRTEFEVEATSPTDSPSSMDVTLEGSVFARSAVNQTIELFDYVATDWVAIDTSAASRFSDNTVMASATGDLSRFVEAGTLRMKARVRFQSVNPRQNFASNTDLFEWTIGQ